MELSLKEIKMNKKSKKAQEEMVGFALIMIVVAVVVLIFLAFSIGSIVNVLFLEIGFRKIFGKMRPKRFSRSIFEVICASALMGLVSYIGLRILDNIFNLETFIGVFFQGLFAGIAGILACIFVLWSLKNEEFSEILKALHQKFWRAKIISQEPEKLP